MRIDGVKYSKEEVKEMIESLKNIIASQNGTIHDLLNQAEKRDVTFKSSDCLVEMFNAQYELQKLITGIDKPVDSVKDFHYSMTALVTEIGEVFSADKRWKTHRNDKYNRVNKLEELTDCMAFLVNAIIYSGFDPYEFYTAFVEKHKVNMARLEKP